MVRQLNRIWDEAYADTGLSAPHAYLLRMACRHPGLTQKDVAEELHLEKSTITRFVNSLIDKALLQRKKGGDGRENRLYPTAVGKKLGKRLDEIGQALYKNTRKKLGCHKFESLVKDLRSTLNQLQ